MNWFTRPIELPAAVRRLLPKSWIRVLAAAALVALWLRPNLNVLGYSGYVAAGQLEDIFPANVTVPLTALVLLVSGWSGARRIELLSVLVLWLQAVVIAILVPLGLVSGHGGIVLALYIAMVSALYSVLVARPVDGAPRLIDGTQLQAEVRRAVILGCGVGMLAVVLLFPVFLSGAARTREDNVLYAGLTRVSGSRVAPPPVNTSVQKVAIPLERSQLPPRPPIADAAATAAQYQRVVRVSAAKRCSLLGQLPEDLVNTTQQAWSEALKASPPHQAEVDSTRQYLFKRLVDAYLKPSSSNWLSVALPTLQQTASATRLVTAPLPWDAELTATPNIAWTRPTVAAALAHYSVRPPAGISFVGASSFNASKPRLSLPQGPIEALALSKTSGRPADPTVSGQAPAADRDPSEAEGKEGDSKEQQLVTIFPIDIDCSMVGMEDHSSVWIYPMAGTTSAVPQAESQQEDGRVRVSLPVASIERAASIVDFARFIGSNVTVTLAPRETTEISPGEPDRSWVGLSWGIEVTTDLPALAIVDGQLIPGRLTHAHGDEACVADSSIDLVLNRSPGGPVTGIVLLGHESVADRVTVLKQETDQRTHDELRSSHTRTLVDVTGDHGADLVFESVKYEVSGSSGEGDKQWVAGPWSWVGVASTESPDDPYDLVTYPGCGKR